MLGEVSPRQHFIELIDFPFSQEHDFATMVNSYRTFFSRFNIVLEQ